MDYSWRSPRCSYCLYFIGLFAWPEQALSCANKPSPLGLIGFVILVSFLVIIIGLLVLLVRSDLGFVIALLLLVLFGNIRLLVRSDFLIYYYLVV